LRDAVRAKEIVTILLKYRFDELLGRIETPAAWLNRITPSVKGNYTLWQRIRLAAEELGPTFIKVCQVLSTRPDILPPELISELGRLRDQVTPLPFDRIQPVLDKALGQPYAEVFSQFDTAPVAAGSVGQIYRATLRTGEEVAVKVQKPGIRKPILTDLEIIEWFAAQLHEHVPELRPFDLPEVVKELRKGILAELDFTIEARNATLFNSLNQYPEKVFAPQVFDAFTDPRLLVAEWIDGKGPSQISLAEDEGRRIADAGGSSFFSQIVVTGFFHGDPHGGNILITPDGRICFIDWGLAGQLTRQMRYHLVDLFQACAERNASRVTNLGIRMSRSTLRIDTVALEKAVTASLFKHDQSLRRMENLGNVIFDLIFVFGSHGIHLARDYTLLAKAVISIEKTAKALDPAFNLVEVGKPFIRQITLERWNPLNITRGTLMDARRHLATLAEIPADFQRLLHRIEDEDVGIQLHHQGLERFNRTIDGAFSRLALAVILGALLIGSSTVITTGVQPLLWGYPAIGIIGYLMALVLGFYVVFDILRHGRHR